MPSWYGTKYSEQNSKYSKILRSRDKELNLSRSPTKFNNPSGLQRITSESPKSIVCNNPSIKPFIRA
jgi:hypothetical protein